MKDDAPELPALQRRGRFEPKVLDTLRDCMRPLIGRSFEFEWAGQSGDDEPYPGQHRWMIARWHDAELEEDQRARWFPDEDIAWEEHGP